MQPSKTYLKYRAMIEDGRFYGKELSWISQLFRVFEEMGLITEARQDCLSPLRP